MPAILKGGNGDIKRTQLYDSAKEEPEAPAVDGKVVDEKKETKASVVESTKTVLETVASIKK